jgi:hypothetical protein
MDPLTRFGSSAFGPVRVRAVSANGAAGDWLSLGTLVRLPGFKELRCPRSQAKLCVLTANNLFLADSISATPDFENPTEVPPEYTGTQLSVPHPSNGILYLVLRDDPSTVQTLTLPVNPVALPASEAATVKSKSAAAPPASTPEPQPATAPAQPSPNPPAEAPATPSSVAPPAATTQTPPPAPTGENQPKTNK